MNAPSRSSLAIRSAPSTATKKRLVAAMVGHRVALAPGPPKIDRQPKAKEAG